MPSKKRQSPNEQDTRVGRKSKESREERNERKERKRERRKKKEAKRKARLDHNPTAPKLFSKSSGVGSPSWALPLNVTINISSPSSQRSSSLRSSSGSGPQSLPSDLRSAPKEYPSKPCTSNVYSTPQIKKGNVENLRLKGNRWLEEAEAQPEFSLHPPISKKEKKKEKQQKGDNLGEATEEKQKDKERIERFMSTQAIGFHKRMDVLQKCTETAWAALVDMETTLYEHHGRDWMQKEKAKAMQRNLGEKYDDFRSLCQFFWNVVNHRREGPEASWEIFNLHAVPAANMLTSLREMGFMAAHRDQKLKVIRDTQLITYVSQTLTLVECLSREWDEGRAYLAELSAMVSTNGTGRRHSTLHARQNFIGMLATMAKDGGADAKKREVSYGTLNKAIRAIDKDAPGVLDALLNEYEAHDNQRLAIAATLPVVLKHVWKSSNDERAEHDQ